MGSTRWYQLRGPECHEPGKTPGLYCDENTIVCQESPDVRLLAWCLVDVNAIIGYPHLHLSLIKNKAEKP